MNKENNGMRDYGMDKMKSEFTELFERTLNNCKFYRREKDIAGLLNEIGVLRGIAYCMEAADMCPHTEEFVEFIRLQQEMKSHAAG